MAIADVLVLRSSGTDGGARGGGDGTPGTDAGTHAGTAAWPASWLSQVLGQGQEDVTVDGVVHRYRGAPVLYTSGCRLLEVTGSPASPTSVRLTVVWGDEAPAGPARAAFLGWWTAEAGRSGWQPTDTDSLYGAVVVARYVPTDAPVEADADAEPGARVVQHDWLAPHRGRVSFQTSGRRT